MSLKNWKYNPKTRGYYKKTYTMDGPNRIRTVQKLDENGEPIQEERKPTSLKNYKYKAPSPDEPDSAATTNTLEDLSASVTPAVNKPKNLFNDDFTKNALKYMGTHPNGNPYTTGINNNPQPVRPLSGDTKSPEFQSLVEMSKKVDANNAKTVKSKEQYEREAAIAKAVSPKLVYDSTIQNGMRGDRIAEDRFRTSARANSQLAGAANATRQGDALKTDVYNSAAVSESDALKNYELSQSELETYYYISGVHGKEEGKRYLDRVRDSRINPKIAEKAYSDITETTGIPGAIGRLGVAVGAGLSSSKNSLAAIPQLMGGGTDVPPRSASEYMGALVQQDPNNKIKTATEIAQSFGTNLPSQATGLVLGPAAGSTVLALQMGAGAYREAINEGRNVGEARMFGTLQGVDEYVTNQLLNGTVALGGSVLQKTLTNTKVFTAAKAGLRSMFTSPTMRTVVGMGMDQLASMGSEWAQEFTQYFTEELERYIAFGESDMDLSDPKTWEEAAHAGWVGALNALAMNVPATAMQGVGTYNAGKYAGMGYQDIADSIRPTAAQYTDQNIRDSARNVFDMARDFQTKEAEGKKVSFFDRGLFEAAAEDYNNAVLNYNRDHARPVYEEAFRTEETAPEEAAPVEDTATAENVASETTNRESANDYIKRRQAENAARQATTQAMNDVASETAKDTGEAFRNANYYNSQRMTPGERIFNAEMSQDMASTFGEEGRKAFSALPAEEGVKAYREWAAHYNNMRFGIPLNPNAESRLSPEQISAAMRAGALDANRAYPQDTMKAVNRAVNKIRVNGVNAGNTDLSGIDYKSLTPQQKLRVDYTSTFITKGLGMDVRYVKSEAVDGKYKGMNGSFQVINGRPTMTLDVNAGMNRESDWTGDITDIKTMLPVISHETTHFLEQYNPKLYKELSSTVLASLQNSGSYSKGMTINSIIEAERQRLNDTIKDENGKPVQHTQEDAIHELVARACEDMLSGDKKALDAFNSLDSQTKQTLWDHVKQVFDNIREFFAQMLSSYKSDSAEAKAIRQNMEEFEKIRDLWDEALNSERVVPASDITSSQESTANTGAGEFSVRQFAQALDFDVRINREGQAFEIIDPHTGKAIKHVTEEMMEQTPMGFMVRSAQNAGTIDQKTADKQIKMFKDLMNLTLRYDQGTTPMVWEIAGSFLFSSVKTNADKQYSTTVDYGTICSKTQALIDVLSKTMVEKGRGLTREEVIKAYNKTANTGLSVPCPVCYVFSRWMGVPSLLETMRKCQERFGNASEQEVQSYIQTMLDQYGDAKGVNSEKTKVQNRLATLERRLQEAVSKNDLAAQTDIQKEVRSLEKKMSDLESFNWVTQVRCVKGKNGKYTLDRKYRSVPNEVLLDLRRSGDFAQKYPKSWKYRTTRGAGMGKAIMPYSGATIGDFIKGTKDRWTDAKNPFYSKNTKAARSAISRAQARAKAQNLIGGQRFQSTSDFRAEWGIDYLMTFLECQLANSQVQLYTKVIEAVDMFASAGAEVNLSIMPRDNGHVNGKLVFSDVTGVNFNDALRKTRKYDNVQMILVGINDDHIRLAMADDRITFIIPWHSSGNSKDTLASLMKSVGETLNNASDYSETQNDKVIDNSDGMKAIRKFRKDIIQGNLWENYKSKTVKALTAEQQSMLDGNQYLSDLYRRFYQDASAKEYGVRLNGNQSSSIFPYEYWDTSLTVKDADQNGRRFQEYCASLGIQPRFSQFAGDTGYWKLLIDRRMYNRDGTYHDPKAIDVTNVKVSQVPQAVNSNNYKDMSKINQATLDTIRAIDEAQNDLAVTEDVTHTMSEGSATEYSLRMVDEVEPSSSAWKSGFTTEQAMEVFPNLWNVAAEESDTKNPTSVKVTLSSYKKIYDQLKAEGFNGTIMDASSGLGYGTESGINDYGFDVEDIEPYPGSRHEPTSRDYSTWDKTYDVVISNAVLNVLPQEQRDAMVSKIGEMLNPGGRAFVNVRSVNDVKAAKSKLALDADNGEYVITSTGSYQKGFSEKELVAYLEDALGEGYTVTPSTKKYGSGSNVWAEIRKDGSAQYSTRDIEEAADSDDRPDVIRQGSDKDIQFSTRIAEKNLDNRLRVNMATFFSGTGTVDFALRNIVRHEFAVEYDAKIAAVYRANNGDNIYVDDVRNVNIDSHKGKVEYFHASPVCKSYSKANNDMGEKPLDIETARATANAIRTLQPKVVTVENVARYKNSEAVKIIEEALEGNGYDYDVKVYSATDFGGATIRQRMFIRAVKDGVLPEVDTSEHARSWYSVVEDLIPELPEAKLSNYMEERLEPSGIDIDNLDQPVFVLGGEKSGKLTYATADKPAPTLLAKSTEAKILMPDGRVLRATPRVMARIQGLPDGFDLMEKEQGITNAYKVVGNGVPVQLTQGIVGPLLEENLIRQKSETTGVQYSTRDTDYAPTFYSKLQREIQNYKGEKIGTASVESYLKGKGVKDEEIKWSGIRTFLEGKKSVNKAELMQYLKDNEMQIEETVSGGGLSWYDDLNATPFKSKEDAIAAIDDYLEYVNEELTDDEKLTRDDLDIRITDDRVFVKNDYEIVMDARAKYEDTNWSEYKLDGGSNYREVLFSIPNSDYSNQAMRVHWKGKTGVLAHARIQDFETEDGDRVLFVEEIQSDWHNAGQKEGYADNAADESTKVPDAPYRTTYTDYVLKNLLRMAAEENYDYLAWTTGKMQEERWSDQYAEGYRIEYDQQIPKFLKKYGKQWGAGLTNIPLGAESEGEQRALDRWRESRERFIAENPGPYSPSEQTRIDYMNGEIAKKERRVPAIVINDAMKESVLHAGQPMFSQRNVDIDARIDALVKKYGAMPTGEHPQRSEQLPKQTSDGKNLRRFARTVWESGITTDDIDNEIKKAIIDESLSYEVKTDEEAAEYASSVIRIGGVERAQKEWDRARRSDTFNKDHMALGQFLLKEYAKNNDVENAMKMIQELAAEGTRMGQNIQAMRMLKKYSQKVPAIGLGYIQRTVDQMNRDAKRKMGKKFQKMEIDQKLADAYLNAKTQNEIDSAIADIYIDLGSQVQKTTTEDVVDRLRTWRYMAMLGNPRTHIRNLVGNALFVPAVQMKNAIGAGLEGTMKTKTRTKAVRISKEAAAFAKQDALEMKDRLSGRQDLSIRDLIMEQRKVFSSKALNTLSEKNSQALETEDWIFLRRHYENSLAQYITANKLDTTQENPAWLGKAREYAVLEAQKATYRDANKVSAWLNQSGKAGTIVKYMMEGMLPFKKTPTNILRRGVEYSPAGLVATLTKGTRDLNTGKITVNEWIDGVSSGLTGTAIFGLGMFLASTGAILGGYDDDDDKELRKLKGLQEYSVRIGNKTYTIDWAAPGSLPLFIGVETMSALQSERGVTMDDMGKSVMRMIDPMINMSMLSGLNDTLDAISYSENKLSAAAMETFYSLLGQYVPTLFGQVARTIDTTQRINYQDKNKGMSKDMLYFIEKMQNKIPFLTFSNDPYLNEFGQENDSGPHWAAALQNFVSPGYISSVKDDKVINEIERLQGAQEENVLPKKMPRYLGTKENRVDLTSEQYTLFQRTAGQTAYNILDRMIDDRRYDRMNADEQAAAIKMAYDYAKAVGRIAVQPEYESDLKGDTKKIYNAVKDRKQAFSAILDLCAEKKEKKKSK